MLAKIKVSDLPDFDLSEHLDSEQAIAEYLNACIEDGDAALQATAMGDIDLLRARAEGRLPVAQCADRTKPVASRTQP